MSILTPFLFNEHPPSIYTPQNSSYFHHQKKQPHALFQASSIQFGRISQSEIIRKYVKTLDFKRFNLAYQFSIIQKIGSEQSLSTKSIPPYIFKISEVNWRSYTPLINPKALSTIEKLFNFILNTPVLQNRQFTVLYLLYRLCSHITCTAQLPNQSDKILRYSSLFYLKAIRLIRGSSASVPYLQCLSLRNFDENKTLALSSSREPLNRDLWEHCFSFIGLNDLNSIKDVSRSFLAYSVNALRVCISPQIQINPIHIRESYRLAQRYLLSLTLLSTNRLNKAHYENSRQTRLPLSEVFTFFDYKEKIEKIDLPSLPINDDDVEFLSLQCPQITHLNLARCVQITDRSLKILEMSFPKLDSLNLFGCSKLTWEGFTSFRVKRPEIIHHYSMLSSTPSVLKMNFELHKNIAADLESKNKLPPVLAKQLFEKDFSRTIQDIDDYKRLIKASKILL